MKKVIIPFMIIVLAFNTTFISSGNAAIINAASCSQAHVRAAIDAAKTGDTVVVPPGTCSWGESVTIPNSKKITLIGAGIDSTIIKNAGTKALSLFTGLSGPRVSGFTFNDINVVLDVAKGFRIDHMKFNSPTLSPGSGILIYPGAGVQYSLATGLVDHCIFNNSKVVVYGGGWITSSTIWTLPLDLGGTDNVVYIEDCEFNRVGISYTGNAIDGNQGGTYVFRYNTLNGVYIEAHSVQATNRAHKKWEVYGNFLNQPKAVSAYLPFRLRAATGVVFYNSVTGYWSNPRIIGLDNVRSYSNRGDGGMCMGGSLWDGNEALISGSHTGNNGDTNLTDSSKSWRANELLYIYVAGTHSGGNDASILTTTVSLSDANNDRKAQLLHNLTDGSWCEITANTSRTATCTLSGGTGNDWDTGDSFNITAGYWVWNLTSGAKCQIVSHSANTAVCTLIGGARQTWKTGDTYKITNGYPCRDQIGRGSDNPLWVASPAGAYTQPLTPAYGWLNRTESNAEIPFRPINFSDRHIQANRDFYGYNAAFSGNTGVGCGTLASRPATCTKGVGYWATNQSCSDLTGMVGTNPSKPIAGTFYKCTATDTWTAYYTPFTYPHPLTKPELDLKKQN